MTNEEAAQVREALKFLGHTCTEFANSLPLVARAPFIREAERHMQSLNLGLQQPAPAQDDNKQGEAE